MGAARTPDARVQEDSIETPTSHLPPIISRKFQLTFYIFSPWETRAEKTFQSRSSHGLVGSGFPSERDQHGATRVDDEEERVPAGSAC